MDNAGSLVLRELLEESLSTNGLIHFLQHFVNPFAETPLEIPLLPVYA